MSTPAMAAAQEGARYQYRFFWHVALPMLYMDTPPVVEKVVMEHRDVAAVDDVVVYYSAPGMADGARRIRIDYYQIKYHVAQGECVHANDLIDPTWTGTANSLLARFGHSWRDLRTNEASINLNLVTNWSWCADDPLAPLIRDNGWVDEKFFTSGERSKVGTVRRAWREHLLFLDDHEFEAFIRQLRLCVRAVSQRDAGEWLANRCQLAGLRVPNPSENHSPYDDLAGRLLVDGWREFTKADLAQLVKDENLIAEPSVPYQSTCAVRSFRRFAHVPETDATVLIDLTDLFEGRTPVRDDVWRDIPDRLVDALPRIDALPRPVQLALDTHLSVGWYMGTLLDAKAGIPVLLRQKGYGRVELWDTASAGMTTDPSWQIDVETLGNAPDLALAVSVTHDVVEDVRATVATLPAVGRLAHARLPELGSQAVRSGAHAIALADVIVRAARDLVRSQAAARTHVFAACPVSLAFLLGQRSSAIGPLTMYEFDFGGTRTYRPALAIP